MFFSNFQFWLCPNNLNRLNTCIYMLHLFNSIFCVLLLQNSLKLCCDSVNWFNLHIWFTISKWMWFFPLKLLVKWTYVSDLEWTDSKDFNCHIVRPSDCIFVHHISIMLALKILSLKIQDRHFLLPSDPLKGCLNLY